MVDDSAADRKLYRMLLEDHIRAPGGLEVIEAHNASTGLSLCRTVAPDCVLLDYKLPDMTGLEFLAQLTGGSSSDVPTLAVVMLTGLFSEKTAVEALGAGAQDYLTKDHITAEGLSMAVEKATQKVRLLRALKEERDRLARSVAEKDVLLHEVHHRVKNNLQVIVSLLRLQSAAIPDPRLSKVFLESQHRVESMALIHEQLYQTKDMREVDLAEQVWQLAANLFHSYGIDGHIALRLEIDPLRLPVDRAIPAGLILNELISNALEHAFPEGRRGTLTIQARATPVEGGACVTLEVRDDGVGLSETVNTREPNSLGLRIVKILTRQLKGVFEAVPAATKRPGAIFRVTFPVTGSTPRDPL